MQRGLTPDRGLVGAGLVLDQEDDDVHAAHEAGDVKWGQSRLDGRKDNTINLKPY